MLINYRNKRRGDNMAIYAIGDLHLSGHSDKPMDIFEIIGQTIKIK